MNTAVSFIPLIIILTAVVFGLLCFAFWIWMLIDCLQNQKLVGTEKVVWVLLIVFLHGLGALIYFFVERPKARTVSS